MYYFPIFFLVILWKMEETEQTRKLFLGGLNYTSTEDSLTSYFSQWGSLVDCIVMRFPDSRRSRYDNIMTYSRETFYHTILW